MIVHILIYIYIYIYNRSLWPLHNFPHQHYLNKKKINKKKYIRSKPFIFLQLCYLSYWNTIYPIKKWKQHLNSVISLSHSKAVTVASLPYLCCSSFMFVHPADMFIHYSMKVWPKIRYSAFWEANSGRGIIASLTNSLFVIYASIYCRFLFFWL